MAGLTDMSPTVPVSEPGNQKGEKVENIKSGGVFETLVLIGTHQGPVMKCAKPGCKKTWYLSDFVGLGHVNALAVKHLTDEHGLGKGE